MENESSIPIKGETVEFDGIAHSCPCDGAVDDGCENCWTEEELRRRYRISSFNLRNTLELLVDKHNECERWVARMKKLDQRLDFVAFAISPKFTEDGIFRAFLKEKMGDAFKLVETNIDALIQFMNGKKLAEQEKKAGDDTGHDRPAPAPLESKPTY